MLGNKPIVVHEGENVRMRCAATGIPRPSVEWRKADGSAIPLGSWQSEYNCVLLTIYLQIYWADPNLFYSLVVSC